MKARTHQPAGHGLRSVLISSIALLLFGIAASANAQTIPERGFGVPIIQGVFPMVRTIARPGEFGLEMALTF